MRSIQLLTVNILSSIVMIACNSNSSNEEQPTTNTDTAASTTVLVFDQLAGTWKSEDGQSFERWIKNGDGTYQTDVYAVKGADTTWKENGKVYPENNNWVYENRVANQNEGKAIKFTSTKLTDNSVQFSNPAHDFPTDINYTVSDPNTVNAFIIGPNAKGGRDTIRFNYTRHKQ